MSVVSPVRDLVARKLVLSRHSRELELPDEFLIEGKNQIVKSSFLLGQRNLWESVEYDRFL